MLLQTSQACWGDPDDPVLSHDESAVDGIFPDGEFGTGCAPGFHYFFVGPVALCKPGKKIEDQGFNDGIGHGLNISELRIYLLSTIAIMASHP